MKKLNQSTILYFVRHGESDSNTENRIQGHTDSGLSVRGLRQAQKLAKRLSKVGIKKIISSDLGRAKTTAQVIATEMRKKISINPELREICLGVWEGLTTDQVDHQYNNGYQRWLQSPSKMKIPGAESMGGFHHRVRSVVDTLFHSHLGEGPILVVTHGGVIASLLAHWLRADFDHVLLNLRVDNTSVTVVEKNAYRHKIHCLNDISHLRASDLGRKNIFTER